MTDSDTSHSLPSSPRKRRGVLWAVVVLLAGAVAAGPSQGFGSSFFLHAEAGASSTNARRLLQRIGEVVIGAVCSGAAAVARRAATSGTVTG